MENILLENRLKEGLSMKLVYNKVISQKLDIYDEDEYKKMKEKKRREDKKTIGRSEWGLLPMVSSLESLSRDGREEDKSSDSEEVSKWSTQSKRSHSHLETQNQSESLQGD